MNTRKIKYLIVHLILCIILIILLWFLYFRKEE